MTINSKGNSNLGSDFVLVIEPSTSFRASLKTFFKKMGITNVKFLTSTEHATREMLLLKVGLLIVERQLTGKSGLQFCRELRSDPRHKAIPFLLMGTEGLKKDVILASEGGVDGYLVKPFSYDHFYEQVSSLLGESSKHSNFNQLLERAEKHLEKGETWVAEALFIKAQNTKPDSARALCGLARIALLDRDYTTAKEKLNQAIQINPDYLEIYKILLNLSQESKDQKGLIDSVRTLHLLSPENPRYPLIMADILLRTGEIEASENFFKLAQKLSTCLTSRIDQISRGCLANGTRGRSDQHSSEASLDLDRADALTLNSLGLTYAKMNLLDSAIEKYQMALNISPHQTEVLINLALAYEQRGDISLAQHCIRQALSNNPFLDEAKLKLAQLGSLLESNEKPLVSKPEEESSVTLRKRA